jgi:Protein of unknown function (DUF1616)
LTQEVPEQTLKEVILATTKQQKPETVDQLSDQVHQQFPSVSNAEITNAILTLQSEGKLSLEREKPPAHNLMQFLTSDHASWYWITFALTLAAVMSVVAIAENAYPFVFIRYMFGGILVLWLPGYAFIKTLFPTEVPFKTSDRNLDLIERVVLSFGMSLALVPIVGLLLNYTPWGIRLIPITLSLTALTLTFATAALIREYQSSNKSGAQATELVET